MQFTNQLPKLCHLCGLSIERSLGHNLWCHHCLPLFNFHQHRCQQCGLTFEGSASICGECLKTPPPWNKMVCLGDYQHPLSHFIKRIKNNKQPSMVKPLTQMLSKKIDHPSPILISVPMLFHHEFLRGFNLSEMMANDIANQFSGSKCAHHIFRKHRHTRVQKDLNREERLHNVRRAFSLKRSPSLKHVAIIDDVVTTGATVRHLSELLLEVGVEKIDIYCLCRTPKSSH
ncbi:ComF family protein [Vibrio sp. SCSIO 43140]|nr:ComF family protein [Vibrio sp. SCSIO 43140]